MAPKANMTGQSAITLNTREIDFVSRFALDWRRLQEVMGISRLIEKVPGQSLRVITAAVTLQSGSVGEGEEIPYSKATVSESVITEATLLKYKKGVSIEAINKYGYADAVARTDTALLRQLQSNILDQFFTFMLTGTADVDGNDDPTEYATFQMACAMARAAVIEKFEGLNLSVTEIVGFANVTDFYSYVGAANLTVQTAFGLNYIENFMGYNRIFLCDSNKIPSGKFVAIPVENLVAYYINPATSDFAQAGLEFTVDGETPMVGFHTEGNYSTLVSENTAIMGVYLFAEYLDGIAVVSIASE